MERLDTGAGAASETGRRHRAEDQGVDLFRFAVETALTDHGASADTAAIVAKQAVAWLQRHAGSQRLWIASGRSKENEASRASSTEADSGSSMGEV